MVQRRFIVNGRAAFLGTALVVAGVVSIHASFADDVVPTATPFPKSGVLASTGDLGYGKQGHQEEWGGTALEGNNPAPISGSVVKSGDGKWTAKIFNNSKDSYAADVELMQLGASRNTVKTDNFSVSLAPGRSENRAYNAAPNSAGATLKLLSWKKTSTSKPEAAASPAAAIVPTAAPTLPPPPRSSTLKNLNPRGVH